MSISDKETYRIQRILMGQMTEAQFRESGLTIGDLIKNLIKKNDQLEEVNKKLLVALKSQHQPHMDYVHELDTTVTELLTEIENG